MCFSAGSWTKLGQTYTGKTLGEKSLGHNGREVISYAEFRNVPVRPRLFLHPLGTRGLARESVRRDKEASHV